MLEKIEHPHVVEIQIDDDHPEQALVKNPLGLFERSHECRAAIRQAFEQSIVNVGCCDKNVGRDGSCHAMLPQMLCLCSGVRL